jgi:hypothetical protein
MLKKLALVAGLATSSLAFAQNETVYAAPAPTTPDQGSNQGGVQFQLDLLYLTAYVYRGVDYNKAVDPTTKEKGTSNTDVYSDAKMSFDLGPKMPHPFVSVSANVYDSDPVSKFQEFRPAVGADLTLRPITFTAGVQSYIYPKREQFETSEIFGQIALDDARIWNSDKPILSPYIMGAYDYDLNNGTYLEAGIRHDFVVEDYHLTLTPVARIAYMMGWQQQFSFVQEDGTGWQHWDLGIEAKYSLNSLLNMSHRWGDWYLRAMYYHTEHLANTTVGQSEDWGGIGIRFEY